MKYFKIIGIILLVLIIVALGYLSYSYYQITNQTQKDLGVRYTQEDADKAIKDKAGVQVDDLSKIYFGSNFRTEGSVKVDKTFTDAEISAIQNYANVQSGPFKHVQIHFIGGNKVEASGFVNDPRVTLPGPVYVKGDVIQTGPKSFTTNIDELKVGNYVVPRAVVNQVQSEFLNYVNSILSNIDGLNVEKVEIQDGQVRFIGNLPAKVYSAD